MPDKLMEKMQQKNLNEDKCCLGKDACEFCINAVELYADIT